MDLSVCPLVQYPDTAALTAYCINRNIFSRRQTYLVISPPHPPLF